MFQAFKTFFRETEIRGNGEKKTELTLYIFMRPFKFRQLFLIGIEKIKIKRKFQNWSIKKNLKFNLLLGVLFSIEPSSLNFFPRKAMTCLLPEWSVPEMEKNGTKSWDLPKGSGMFET